MPALRSGLHFWCSHQNAPTLTTEKKNKLFVNVYFRDVRSQQQNSLCLSSQLTRGKEPCSSDCVSWQSPWKMSLWHPEQRTAKDMSWNLTLCQLSQGNAKSAPLSSEPVVLWEGNAHGHFQCPSHTDCKSALLQTKTSAATFVKTVRAEAKSLLSVSGLVLGLFNHF